MLTVLHHECSASGTTGPSTQMFLSCRVRPCSGGPATTACSKSFNTAACPCW